MIGTGSVVGPTFFHVQNYSIPGGTRFSMITIAVLATLATASTLLVAAFVGVFVAYPLRNRQVPHAPWLSQPMERIRDNLDPVMEWSADRPGIDPTDDETAGQVREHRTPV
jgi:hypothetical protein